MQVTPETPERAAMIGSQSVREIPVTTCPHCSAVLFLRDGKCEDCGKRVATPPPVRRVFDQWPLKRLHVRGILTDTQFEAGLRYYAHWYGAGLVKLGSISFESVGARGERSAMPSSMRQAYHREKYRAGEAALGPILLPYVDAIVLHEEEPEAVGRRLSGRIHTQQARAVAIEFLKGGLDVLVGAYALG